MDHNHFLIFTPTTSHFRPLTSFSFIFFTVFLLTTSTVLAKVDSQFLACEPKTCGDGQNITYPFYIQDQQPPFCGYPGFDVSCNNKGNPVLQFPDNDNRYIIHHIFYKNQSLRVSYAGVRELNSSSGCHVVSSWQNLSLPLDRFELVGNQRDVFVLYNCNNQSLPERLVSKKVECNSTDDDVNGVVLAVGEDDPDLGLARKECRDVVVAPVEGYGEDSMAMMTRLRSGFFMKWTASNCSYCEEGGGRCGFDNSTYHFNCFCPDRPHAWRCRDPGHATEGRRIKIVIAITVSGIGVLIILALCFRKRLSIINSIAFWEKKCKYDQNIQAFLRNNGSLTPKIYSYSDIKRMTNSFKHKLGQGGYGGVYKGKLLDGREVAVKVLNGSKSNGEDFINEVASISRTSHVNIVGLLGYCFESQRRALIYEFVPNGSLEKFIYEKHSTGKQLNWKKLHQIALGIARGLEYLHLGCSTRILHFDIKPHNILLDENFCPKISDFGLAKICPRKESIISMTGARGTVGYIAPEVFCRSFGQVSHKSDVYSYGMMVLEMVGGRKNIDVGVNHTSEIYFPHWIYNRLEVDEELGLKGIENEEDNEYARKMTIVSLWCIQTNPSSRPAISRVVEMLEGNLHCLQIPPKPFLSSPKSEATESTTSLIC